MTKQKKYLNVVILGSSSGLGKELALTYGKYQNCGKFLDLDDGEGEVLNIVLIARRKSLLEELESNLKRSDRNIKIIEFDIINFDVEEEKNNIIKISNNFFKNFNEGKIDHLICNAGILVKDDINNKPKITYETEKKIINNNFLAHKRIIEESLKYMAIDSTIAITNSVEGIVYLPTPFNYFGTYSKTKKLFHKWINKYYNLDIDFNNKSEKIDIILKYGEKKTSFNSIKNFKKKNDGGLRKFIEDNYKHINVVEMFPSGMRTQILNNIINYDGKKLSRNTEFNNLNVPTPYMDVLRYTPEQQSYIFYFGILNKDKFIYSSVGDKFICNLPYPINNRIIYIWWSFKNLSLIDIPMYIILQLLPNIKLFYEMEKNNNYIKAFVSRSRLSFHDFRVACRAFRVADLPKYEAT